jgi:hypothetical protein
MQPTLRLLWGRFGVGCVDLTVGGGEYYLVTISLNARQTPSAPDHAASVESERPLSSWPAFFALLQGLRS